MQVLNQFSGKLKQEMKEKETFLFVPFDMHLKTDL